MSNRVIAAVPVAADRLVAWFEGGNSRVYDAQDLGILTEDDLTDFDVSADCSRIDWACGVSLSADDLSEKGQTFDIVSDEKMRLLKSLSAIRREASFSQTRLGDAAGIRQSVISRIEGCEISPQINTLLKLLAPLGKTLAVVDLTEHQD